MKKEELVLENKIKDISIDKKQYLVYLQILLVLFNLFLLAGVIVLVVFINQWFVYVIDILIVAFCIYRSIVTMKAAEKNHGYTLYENALKVNSLWYDTIVDLSTIYKVVPKKTLVDKLLKRGTNSVVIYFKDGGYFKIKLFHINEDVNKLVDEIMALSLEAKTKVMPK